MADLVSGPAVEQQWRRHARQQRRLLPAGLANPGGTSTTPYNQSYTLYNASKHYQLNEDVAFFKSGWAGTHNFKFGYQLNHLSNVIAQNGNVPLVLAERWRGPVPRCQHIAGW